MNALQENGLLILGIWTIPIAVLTRAIGLLNYFNAAVQLRQNCSCVCHKD